MKTTMLWAAVAATTIAGAAQAAYLDGSSVTLRYQLSASSSADPLTVGAGPEVACPGGTFGICAFLTAQNQTIDFGDTTIDYLFVSPTGAQAGFTAVTPNRFVFDDLDGPGFVLAGATITSPANFTGRLSFDTRSVALDMEGLTFDSNTGFGLNLQFRNVLQVPEPGTALAAGLALLALGATRRRGAARLS